MPDRTDPRSAPGGPDSGGDEDPARHLLLFGTVPEPGRSKTRLAPALGEDGAARLYRAFLEDSLGLARRVAADRRTLWLAGDRRGLDRLRGRYEDVRVRAQRGPDLGARMAHALDRSFREGAGRAVVVGTDHPTLPPALLERAFRALAGADLALGPSEDGGYYAVGLRRRAWPRGEELFDDVPWSTERVLDVTRSRAESAGLTRRELPGWYDVDRPAELERLRRDAGPDSRSAEVLRELAGRGGE